MSSPAFNAARRAVEKAMHDLPPLPAVVTRVLQVTNDDYGSAGEIERLVRSDQAISAKLLRVVNSPYYGLAGRVSNLSQAVVILGFHQVRNIVASLGALSLFESKPPAIQQSLRLHWLHAFGAAACAQLVARQKRLTPTDQELAFVLGLLANIGQLFLVSEFGAQYQQAMRPSAGTGRTLAELEASVFGATHPEVGRMLLERWGLPAELHEPVGVHEGPFAHDASPLALLTHVADRVAWQAIALECEVRPTLSEAPEAWNWLGFADDRLDWLNGEVGTRIESAQELLAPDQKAA
jgi:HD-like signal output (HDOD) protein